LRKKVVALLLALAGFVGLINAQESMEDAPAIEFDPSGKTVILPKVQVHPVLIIHDEPRSVGVPEMYVSIYFADCSKKYSKLQIVSLDVQTPDGQSKSEFKAKYLKYGHFSNGEFVSPFGDEVMPEMLNEEGKKMLQTKVVYVIADPEVANTSKQFAENLRHASEVKLHMEFNLESENAAPQHVEHDFTLKPKTVSLSIVRYDNGDDPINESVIVPENAPGCLE
jgi:hypothetical protein